MHTLFILQDKMLAKFSITLIVCTKPLPTGTPGWMKQMLSTLFLICMSVNSLQMQQTQICREKSLEWKGTGGVAAVGDYMPKSHRPNTHMYTHALKHTDVRKSGLLNSHYHDNTRTEWPSAVNCGIDFVPGASGAELCLLIWPQLSVSLFLLDVSFSSYCYTEYVCVC